MKLLHCKICKKEFFRSPSRSGHRNYCSRECFYEGWRKRGLPQRWKRLRCPNCKGWFKRRMGNVRFKGAHQKRQFCSLRCAGEFHTGPRSARWLGGRTTTNYKRIQSAAWRRIRQAVVQRDCGVCQICGAVQSEGHPFHTDHVIPHIFVNSLAPGREDDIENLALLCPSHHGRKSKAERRLTNGDFLAWKQELSILGYPPAIIDRAWAHLSSCKILHKKT